MSFEQIIAELERNAGKLDDATRSLYQGLIYLLQAQRDLIEQIRQTQKEQQKWMREMQDNLTRLNARFERFEPIERQTQANTEAISNIRGMIWTIAAITGPVAAIIGGIIAAFGPKLFG